MNAFRRRIDAARAREFAETARRLADERNAAPRIVDPLLANTPHEHWPSLSERSEFHTCGGLERLGTLFADWLTKDAIHAKAIAELAVSAAEAMPEHAYPTIVVGQLRAHAWKDFGKALRFLAKNDEALIAFETAERYLDIGGGALGHDRAIVRFNLAMSLQELERFDESRSLLAESKQVFRRYGDTRNTVLCGLAEGVLLQRLKRYREAREIYLLLLASHPSNIDSDSLASIHQVIGMCSIELGDFQEAEENLAYAAKLFRDLKQPIYVTRAELSLGRLFIRRGEPAKGIAHLRLTRVAFLRHSMHEEAGICGLEMVEAFLLLERPEEAERLARTIVGEFTVAGLNSRAITAVGYLSEAIA
ncbi:MAG TPA: tetratricopeptide repeat protein, partial [Thermoanaerobaculia bacterium]